MASIVEESMPILRDKTNSPEPIENQVRDKGVKVYWWRWVVLFVSVANLSITNALWITFSPIADVIACYYSVSNFWVNSLSMVSMLTYMLFIIPSVWLLNRIGLRATAVIGAFLNAAGACLRLAGVGPDTFWLLLLGQTVASGTNLLVWGTPSYVAGIWFPASQRGIAAAAVGALSAQVGVLISFVLGPFLVHSDNTNIVCSGNATADMQYSWTETIYSQLVYYLSGQVAVSLLFIIVTLIGIPNAPPSPPSRSQLLVESSTHRQDGSGLSGTLHNVVRNGYSTARTIVTNTHFMLFLITASINIGAAGAVSSLLNELIHPYFPNRDHDVAYIGLTSQAAAILSMFVTGFVLDYTKAFYVMNLVVYIAAVVSIGGFLAALEFHTNFYVLYPIAALIGASVTAYQSIAYEYSAEMTYPLPEGTSGGLVNWVSQPMSIVMIVVGPKFISINDHKVPVAWTIVALVLLGAVISGFVRPELRKTTIDRNKSVRNPPLNSSYSEINSDAPPLYSD